MDVVTLTLNPAVDVSADVERVVAEDKLRCSDPVRDPGGGGVNVARAVAQLGGEATAVYPVGGPTGELLRSCLEAVGGVTSVAVPVAALTRESLTVTETSTNRQYRFNFPGPRLEEDERAACLDGALGVVPAGGYLVVSGSLPPGTPPAFFAEVAQRAADAEVLLVVDTSDEALRSAAEVGVHLLKPNLRELAGLVGVDHLDEDDAEAAARRLVDAGTTHVLATLGAGGALLVSAEADPLRITAPLVPLRSRVGAGDSTVAGMVLALARGADVVDAALHGVAAGTAAVMTPGTQLCRREDAEALLDRLRAAHGR